MLQTFIVVAIGIALYMTMWFVLSVIYKRADVADIAWGLGFVVAAFTALYVNENYALGTLITCLLVLAWGVRLSLHIGLRNGKKSEDYRYQTMRASWGKTFLIRSYLQIFLAQGFLLLVIVTPVLLVTRYAPSGLYPLLILGGIVWLIGFIFESIGDKQLRIFMRNPENKGKIMIDGLWKYSRHPNYFGEITQWWGISIIALGVPYGWVGLVGPAVLTYLLVKVSGVPLLENKYANRTDYQAYKQRTSMLFPLPPRSE